MLIKVFLRSIIQFLVSVPVRGPRSGAEVAAVWAGAEAGCRDESIPLSEEKIATIKSLMSGVVLGNVPPWARDLGTEGGSGSWRDKLGGQHANPKK